MTYKTILAILAMAQMAFSQDNLVISGTITADGEALPYVNVFLEGTSFGTLSDESGNYKIENVDSGNYSIVVTVTGYKTQRKSIKLAENTSLDFELNTEI
ncbi:MAG: carboxypeptidase-like regulatory domain-containing protein, partial [Flavobacteriaceae bacterium]|nr:carboxypeptidase-like regulatory domain-containing protein [Bacteroidia bacterium]NNL61041.1 carboxypeptidase-like regulatory domain-containing protein [Flavobacteriaceae bacterium]